MATTTAAPTGKIQPRLKQKYRSEIVKALTEQFGYTNPHQVPGLEDRREHRCRRGRP